MNFSGSSGPEYIIFHPAMTHSYLENLIFQMMRVRFNSTRPIREQSREIFLNSRERDCATCESACWAGRQTKRLISASASDAKQSRSDFSKISQKTLQKSVQSDMRQVIFLRVVQQWTKNSSRIEFFSWLKVW